MGLHGKGWDERRDSGHGMGWDRIRIGVHGRGPNRIGWDGIGGEGTR